MEYSAVVIETFTDLVFLQQLFKNSIKFSRERFSRILLQKGIGT